MSNTKKSILILSNTNVFDPMSAMVYAWFNKYVHITLHYQYYNVVVKCPLLMYAYVK